MARRKRDPSIHEEPQQSQSSFESDPSEEKAARKLNCEKLRSDPEEERAKHSVFDEPAILPNRPAVPIERDWTCRNCGYNLRGLQTGHACPECGRVELYEPPREGEESYTQWVARRAEGVTAGASWSAVFAALAASIPLAVGSAFIAAQVALHLFVGIAPVASELLKVATAWIMIERFGYMIRRGGQIYLVTLGAAVFAAIAQNIVYVTLYFAPAPIELVLYRWTVGPILHLTCTAIATRGLVDVWERSRADNRRPSSTDAIPRLALAILLHAAVNAVVFVRGYSGYGF